MAHPASLSVSENLTIAIGAAAVTLSPRQGLELAEEIARKAFRRALQEEAAEVIGRDVTAGLGSRAVADA